MFDGITQTLVVTAAVSWLLAFTSLHGTISPGSRALLVTAKVSLVFVYFAWFYDGSWTIKDDKEYHEQALYLLGQNYNPANLLLTPDGYDALKYVTDRSSHVLYTWWVYSSEYFFGPKYYAPVFMNVVLTCLSGNLLYRLCIFDGFDTGYAKGLLTLFLIHWDLVAWSSFISIKDSLVLMLTLVMMMSLWFLVNSEMWTRRFLWLMGLIASVCALILLRFYIPVLVMTALGGYFVVRREKRVSPTSIALAGGVLLTVTALLAPLIKFHITQDALHIDKSMVQEGLDFIYGLVRFPLTPRPWALEPAYPFLFIPSLLHWLFLVPAVAGAYSLWNRSDLARFLIAYLCVTLLFYAAVDELQTVRMRYQLVFIICWLQFHCLYIAFYRWKEWKMRREGVAGGTCRNISH